MSAFEKWWESASVENWRPEFKWHAEMGWNAAIKYMEAQNTSTNKQSTPCIHLFDNCKYTVKCVRCGAVFDKII